ncbi:hypothetical protein AA313_de0200198 [Arthrobotrys entomopaga]|nr:hypothetical protein AA313_de0200198 [Arthrobotrys entomopaga]
MSHTSTGFPGSVFRGPGHRHPDPPKQTSPVFLVPEILESILIHLPAFTVLVKCRQVSKTWQTVIDSSPSLRYYATVGLRLDKQTQHERLYVYESPYSHLHTRAYAPIQVQVITPMAMELLASFWIKLMTKGYNIHLRASLENIFQDVVRPHERDFASGAGPAPSLESNDPSSSALQNVRKKRVKESKEERNRRRFKSEIERLYKKFALITHRVPLLDPALGISDLSDFKIIENCEWGYILRDNPVAAASDELPNVESIVGKQWVELLTGLVWNVYFRTPTLRGKIPTDNYTYTDPAWKTSYRHPSLLGVRHGSLLVYRFSCNAGIKDAEPGKRLIHETTLFFGTDNVHYLQTRAYETDRNFAELGVF